MKASLTLLIVLAALTSSCGVGESPDDAGESDRFKTITLALPREPESDEALRVVVTVGDLARGDTIVVRTKSGEIAGSIVTAGLRPGQKGGVFPLPVPHDAVEGNQVVIRVEVVPAGSPSQVRAPTSVEVEKIDLKIIPVTHP